MKVADLFKQVVYGVYPGAQFVAPLLAPVRQYLFHNYLETVDIGAQLIGGGVEGGYAGINKGAFGIEAALRIKEDDIGVAVKGSIAINPSIITTLIESMKGTEAAQDFVRDSYLLNKTGLSIKFGAEVYTSLDRLGQLDVESLTPEQVRDAIRIESKYSVKLTAGALAREGFFVEGISTSISDPKVALDIGAGLNFGIDTKMDNPAYNPHVFTTIAYEELGSGWNYLS